MDQISLQNQLLACLPVNLSEAACAGLAQLSAEAWAHLFHLASARRVLPLLWHRLSSQGLLSLIPASIRSQWQEQVYTMTVHNLRLYHELGIILTCLRERHIPVIILKGAYLAAAVYPNQALRMMNDIDLLFARADVPAVTEMLSELGYRPEQPVVLDEYFASGYHLPPFAKADTVAWVEVHWAITRPGTAYTIDIAELWARAVLVTIAGVEALAFCPADLLLHVCEHATYHHTFRQGIRFLCDIDAIVHHRTLVIDWEQVQQRAHAWEWAKGVYLALFLTKHLLGTSIPEAVLRQLQPVGCDAAIVDAASRQIWVNQVVAATISNDFAHLYVTKSLSEKVQILWERIFLSPELMAKLYPVQPGSLRCYLYYAVRCKDLLVRYIDKVWRLWRSEPKLLAITQNKDELRRVELFLNK